MKKTKVVMALACAVLLVGASVMGTLAYLTSTDSVTNTFTVGEGVKMTLDEAKTSNNGDGKVEESASRVKANTYKLMPGHTYTKDPTVHVTGEDCYVFVKVENGITDIEGDNTIASQITSNGWKAVDGFDGLYVYVGTGGTTRTAVSKSTTSNKTDKNNGDYVVFESFTVKDDADQSAIKAHEKDSIKITAFAVQKDGFDAKKEGDTSFVMTDAQVFREAFGKDNINAVVPGPSIETREASDNG